MHQLRRFKRLKIFAFGFLAPRVCLISHSPTRPRLSVVILHPEDTTKSSHHPTARQIHFFVIKNITIGSTLRVHSTLQSIKLVDPAVGVFNLVFSLLPAKVKGVMGFFGFTSHHDWAVSAAKKDVHSVFAGYASSCITSIQSSLNVLS